MRPGLLILTGAAGLAAGLLAGRGTAPPNGSATKPNETTADRAANTRSAVVAGRGSGPADSDDRIARLFTALKEPIYLARRYELREALRDMPASEFSKLVERAAKVPLDMKSDLLIAVMIGWFDADPAAASAWMQSHPEWGWGVEAWARKDPDAAIRDALAGPGRDRSKKALFSAIEKLAGKNPAAMAARLRELPAGELRDKVFTDVLNRWAKTDPATALAAVAEMAPGAALDAASQQIVLTWADADPAAALAQIPAMLPSLDRGVLGSDFLAKLAERVMAKDPGLTLDWLGQLPLEHRSTAAIAGLGVWAKKEPAAALEWCLANDVEVARHWWEAFNSGNSGVLANAVQSAPTATLAWLEARPAGADRDRLIERALSGLLIDRGLAKLNGDTREASVATEDDVTIQRLYQQLPPDEQRSVANLFGLDAGASSDFTDLGAWARRFEPGPARAEAVRSAIVFAYGRDAARAETLLASVRPGADRDAALRAMAQVTSKSELLPAAKHALEIGDPAQRRKTLDTVVGDWLKRDPDTTRAWLREAATIPAAWKAKWLP